MKRILLCLLALCLLVGCGTANPEDPISTTQKIAETYPGFPDAPETFAGMKEAALQPYFELAQETLKRYTLAAYCAPELPQFPMQMSPTLRKYTELRFAKDMQRFPIKEEQLGITTDMFDSWMGDAWQRKWKIIEGKLLCSVGVRVEEANGSGFGMGAQLLLENPRNPMLIDWFDMDKFSWDRLMREGHYNLPDDADPWAVRQWPVSWNLSDPENWLGSCKLLGDAERIFD